MSKDVGKSVKDIKLEHFERFMKFSVITPCYNSAPYLTQAIDSVLTQKGDFELEYIVVDGNSTDDTSKILLYYQELIGEGKWGGHCSGITMKIISEEDSGMYEALAKGFRVATGDIISYLNADDMYVANAFATLAEIFHSHPKISWVTGMRLEYNEKGYITGCILPYTFYSAFIRRGAYGTRLPFVQQESTFWRKELLYYLNFDKLNQFKYAGDYFLWYTFSQHTDLFVVKTILGGFRHRANQLSSQKKHYLEEFRSIADKQTCIYKVILFIHRKWVANRSERQKYRMKRLIYYDNDQWLVNT
jgi:glycosyltransferase involved in cell wall biosynthesis